MKSIAHRQRGVALALALVALVLVGALVAAVLFIGIQEARVGESARRLQRSFGVAEEGASEVIRSWDPAIYNARLLSPLDSAPVPASYPGAWVVAPHKTGGYGGYVYKLNGELYFIDMAGRDSLSAVSGPVLGARQRVGLLARVRPVTPGIEASVTTGNGIRLSGAVTVDGHDRVPPGWGPCGPPDSGKAGVRVRSGAAVAASDKARILGGPPTAIDSTGTASPVARLGDLSYGQLATWATHTVPDGTFADGIGPVVMQGRCNDAVATNWGDGRNPNQPCGTYFPVVHVTGDATMAGMQGQGILLVDGNLVVRGGLEWYGIALIRGSLTVAPDALSDIAMWGAVLVEDSVALQVPVGGSMTITYSKCAIYKALEAVAMVGAMPGRGWVELSDVP